MTIDWQPIKSAPQDGSHILLRYRFGRKIYIGEGWWARAGHWTAAPMTMNIRAFEWAPMPDED